MRQSPLRSLAAAVGSSITLGLVAALLLPPPSQAAKPGARVVTVDCAKGESINAALASSAPEIAVRITGTCAEDVIIARDDVTLEGTSPSTTLVGAGSGPTVLGLPPAIAVAGATRVTLRGFTVTDADRNGVEVRAGGAVLLEQMRLVGSAGHGLLLAEGSSASVGAGCAFDDNGGDGIGVWESSAMTLRSPLTANGNGRVGIIVSNGSGVNTGQGAAVVANDNLYGLYAQFAGDFQLPDVEARNNTEVGVGVFGASTFSAGALTAEGSTYGLLVEHGLADVTAATVTNNTFGVYGDIDASLYWGYAGQVSVTDNTDTGLYLEAGVAYLRNDRIENNGPGGDVVLVFGAQGSFDGSNVVGSIQCDDSVVVRGTPGCPAAATLQAATVSAQAIAAPPAGAHPQPHFAPLEP
jgi:hypothetical protein